MDQRFVGTWTVPDGLANPQSTLMLTKRGVAFYQSQVSPGVPYRFHWTVKNDTIRFGGEGDVTAKANRVLDSILGRKQVGSVYFPVDQMNQLLAGNSDSFEVSEPNGGRKLLPGGRYVRIE